MSIEKLQGDTNEHVQNIKSWIFVRALDSTNAAVRFHICAAEEYAIKDLSRRTYFVRPGASLPEADNSTAIIFYYDDRWAVSTVRKLLHTNKCGMCLCFGSDIKTYRQYHDLEDIVDCFLMPSELHKDILALHCYSNAAVVREAIASNNDPTAQSKISKFKRGQKTTGANLAWFGYPENFLQGMANILDIIDFKIREGKLNSFTIVSNKKNLQRAESAKIVQYNQENISELLATFDYTVLSHYPGDLTINSFIKSNNKAVLSLLSGTIPIVSSTPNYRQVMDMVGLQRFVYSSPVSFAAMLDQLDIEKDYSEINMTSIQKKLCRYFSPEEVYGDILKAVGETLPKMELRRRLPEPGPRLDSEYYRAFTANVKGLIPSALSLAKRKLLT